MQVLRIKTRQSTYLLLILMLAGLLLTACGSDVTPSTTPSITPTQVTKTNPPPEDWELRWLKGIPCKPPCWEGITPGQTTAKEVTDSIRKVSFFSGIEILDPNYKGKLASITWEFVGTNNKVATVYYDAKSSNQTINFVIPTFTAINLSEVIKSYGEPSHIVATWSHGHPVQFELFAIYLTQGFALSNNSATAPILNNSTIFEKVTFFTPGINGLVEGYLPPKKLLIKWDGYKEFSFYCRDPYSIKNQDCSEILQTQKTP